MLWRGERSESILRRTFNSVDNDELQRSAGRLQLEPELFLHGDKDAASIGTGITSPSTRRIEFWELNVEIEAAAQAGSVQHRSVGEQRQHACERAQGLAATSDGAAHFTRASYWLARCGRRNSVTRGFRRLAIDRSPSQLRTGTTVLARGHESVNRHLSYYRVDGQLEPVR